MLDGELVIPVNGVLSLDHLLARFARSGGGCRQQAAEYPAVMFVFDILADEAEELASEPLNTRRERLERFAELYLDGDKGAIRLSPATIDIEAARKWLALAGTSLDGVVAKLSEHAAGGPPAPRVCKRCNRPGEHPDTVGAHN